MKILELCLSPDLGGLELYMQRCTLRLRQSDTVVAVVAPGGRLEERLQREGIKPLLLQWRSKALPLFAAWRLAQIIDREGVELVHIHWGKDLALAALAKAMSRSKPRLVSTRQMQITRAKRDFYHNFLYRQVDLNITITRALAEAMAGFLPQECRERITPLYYGVAAPETFIEPTQRAAIRKELGIDANTFLIGLFGRIKRYKGQHLLVEAITRAVSEGADVAALIVGQTFEEKYVEELKQRVVADGMNERILFRDFVEHPQRLMQACDMIALTTVEETFGLVLVEAMRAGVAVLGSDRGGVPEIIEHGVTGLLFKSGDANDLYAQIKSIWNSHKTVAEFARRGQEKADTLFDEEEHFVKLRALLTKTTGLD